MAADASVGVKKRTENFGKLELALLTEEVEKHFHVITSKQTNEVTNIKKKEEWQKITNVVNSRGTCKRSVAQVKEKWRKMCSSAKREVNDHKKESARTGGGSNPNCVTVGTEKIVSLFSDCPSFHGIDGGMETGITLLPSITDDSSNTCVLPELQSSQMMLTDLLGDNGHITVTDSLRTIPVTCTVTSAPHVPMTINPAPVATSTDSCQLISLEQSPSPLYLRNKSGKTSTGSGDVRKRQLENLKQENEKFVLEKEVLMMKKEKLSLEKTLLEYKIKKIKLEIVGTGLDPNEL